MKIGHYCNLLRGSKLRVGTSEQNSRYRAINVKRFTTFPHTTVHCFFTRSFKCSDRYVLKRLLQADRFPTDSGNQNRFYTQRPEWPLFNTFVLQKQSILVTGCYCVGCFTKAQKACSRAKAQAKLGLERNG